ncbi:type II toxin-antitoxin system VapB family antitoxin [Streptomyces sp. NA02950]|uniref:type II toxin-antitoxin system VapB family antitoxin n=1 Tax=Streptomyces sp. NA02950 TaxID=2742137 RepID=UPI0015924E98|nr:type II toxin-antitoxin system VapB family antitoxin [Streptomyces sp. NA02950]QKV94687.1 type II toxin-antitoxin system VapB family antitoxin [Streptomyces sp. NA02950]
MSATQIDIDDDALAEAMRLSGAKTKKEMVNLALREYAERRSRTEARMRHFEEAQHWDDEEFWQRHAAEKGTAVDGPSTEKGAA